MDTARGPRESSHMKPNVIFSFDVEEHDRIEAARALTISPTLKAHYRGRLKPPTQWILTELANHNASATFFIVGEIATHSPELVRAIHRAGHEVACHGWDHRRVSTMSPAQFRQDVRKCKNSLEQIIGEPVWGYRAPTFSIGVENAWAIDVLSEEGFVYDSSIFPVKHDRYGLPSAPRQPFFVFGYRAGLLEFPPATWRVFGVNTPMGGGGYFRLFPLWFTKRALHQAITENDTSIAVLYFHPWEFDSEQQRLPLPRLSRVRTYVGLARTRPRLTSLLAKFQAIKAIDATRRIRHHKSAIQSFNLAVKCK